MQSGYRTGAQGFIDSYMPFLKNYQTPVIVNIWGKTIEDYGVVTEQLNQEEGIDAYEINLPAQTLRREAPLLAQKSRAFSRSLSRAL